MSRPMMIFAVIPLALALYCATDPFKHSPLAEFPDLEPVRVDLCPLGELPKDKDSGNSLKKSEIMFKNEVQGPESIAFDLQGRGPYTGVADGRVVFWDGESWVDFAHTSANRSDLCEPQTFSMNYMENEHICGRPLGIRFDKRTGDLYIADAYFGIMKVGPEGGLATSITTEAEGVPFRFTNDLDIDDDGNIYFTDSSTKYQRRNFLHLVFSGEDSGRVLKYDPITKETTVLQRKLQFPNGLSLSKDRSFFVFCEGSLGRLQRYWLKGEKAGTSEVFAILPGSPDNVRTNEDGEFWVAIHARRSYYSHVSALHLELRKLMLKMPISATIHYLLLIGGRLQGVAVKYSEDGKLLQILEDRNGDTVKAISEVEEKDGKLWMGSVLMPFIAVYSLN